MNYKQCTAGQRAASAAIDVTAILVTQLVFNAVLPGLGGAVGLAAIVLMRFWEGETGQTLGRKAVGTYLVDATSGEVVGGGRAIGRAFLHILDLLPLGAGFIVGLVTGQCFADRITNTVVVSAIPPRPREVRAPAWWLPREWQR